ncbi:hypothetical protein B0H11DRAFT_1900866 [Mycena galericulata]|nr:hypothetical protein B0H11DRAFT_1900866 [Mycena galericulata]
MHRCLYTEDIVRLLCAQLFHGNRGGLSTVALTSRTFHPHALDFLWREQTSMKPLLKCFPSALWEYSDYVQHLPGGMSTITHHWNSLLPPVTLTALVMWAEPTSYEWSPEYDTVASVLKRLRLEMVQGETTPAPPHAFRRDALRRILIFGYPGPDFAESLPGHKPTRLDLLLFVNYWPSLISLLRFFATLMASI